MLTQLLVIVTACLGIACGQSPPYIEPDIIQGRLGEYVNITCIVGTSEPESTTLTRSDTSLLPNNRTLLNDGIRFLYGPLTADDNGLQVFCTYSQPPYANSTITVLIDPGYSIGVSTIVARESEGQRTIIVTVTGNPIPTDLQTTWTFNGGVLGIGVVATFNSLMFADVQRSHTGIYNVRSTTTAGNSVPLNISLNVVYPPEFGAIMGDCDLDSTPIVCAIREGSTGVFNCVAVGNPSPTVNITKPDSYNVGGDVIRLENASLSESDATITCVATNSEDTSTRVYRVYVGSEPQVSPTNVMVTIDSNTLTLSWEYDNSVNTVPITRFMYTMAYPNGTVVLSGMTEPQVLTVNSDLSLFDPNTMFKAEIFAVNPLGESGVGGNQFVTPTVSPGDSAAATTSCLVSILLMVGIAYFLRT